MTELVQTVAHTVRGDFADSTAVWHTFVTLVNGLPGLTVLTSLTYPFPGGGFSGVVILAESHAAIHTWPERGEAWVELATCGDPAALPAFTARCQRAGWLPTATKVDTL